MKFIWQTYLLPKIDYCCQLWGPTHGKNLQKLENILKSFTRKVEGISHLNYWDRLKFLDISSIGRRIERYRCIYTWKIVNGLAPNCNITWNISPDKGTQCNTIKVNKYYKNTRSQTFQYVGPRLYNSLPRYIRDFKGSKDEFKILLNEFLRKIPDNPLVADLIPEPCNPFNANPTNEIIHWIPLLGLHNRRNPNS